MCYFAQCSAGMWILARTPQIIFSHRRSPREGQCTASRASKWSRGHRFSIAGFAAAETHAGFEEHNHHKRPFLAGFEDCCTHCCGTSTKQLNICQLREHTSFCKQNLLCPNLLLASGLRTGMTWSVSCSRHHSARHVWFTSWNPEV